MSLKGKYRKRADELLLQVLTAGANVDQAAVHTNLSRATITRRLKDPEFQARLHEARSEMVKRSAGMLTGATPEAIKTLVMLLKAPGDKDFQNATPGVRARAAGLILEYSIRIRESGDLEERLSILEQQTSANGPA